MMMKRVLLAILMCSGVLSAEAASVGHPLRSLSGLGPGDRALFEDLTPDMEGEWWLIDPRRKAPRRVVISASTREDWKIRIKGEDEWEGYILNMITRDGHVLFDLKEWELPHDKRGIPTHTLGVIEMSDRSVIARVVEAIEPTQAGEYDINGLGFLSFTEVLDYRITVSPFDPATDLRSYDHLHSELVVTGGSAAISGLIQRAMSKEHFMVIPLILTREPIEFEIDGTPSAYLKHLYEYDPWLGEKIDAIRAASGAKP